MLVCMGPIRPQLDLEGKLERPFTGITMNPHIVGKKQHRSGPLWFPLTAVPSHSNHLKHQFAPETQMGQEPYLTWLTSSHGSSEHA